MNNINAILVDDDKEALSLLKLYLKPFSEVVILGTANNGKDGLKLICDHTPDIIFLDIDMPEMSGIELAKIIRERNYKTQIIFTTAFHEYAYDAINTEPLDYLIKPFGTEAIRSVIKKYNRKLERDLGDDRFELIINARKSNVKLKFPTRTGMIIINPEQIGIIKARGNHSELFLEDGTIELITLTLNKVYDSLIQFPNIYRVNRSSIINLQYLRRVDRKNKICIVSFNNQHFEESLNRQNINFFEDFKSFPIS